MHRDLIVLFGLTIRPSAFALGPFTSVPLFTIAPLNLLISEFPARFGKAVYLWQKQAAQQNAYLLVSGVTPAYQTMHLHTFKNRTVRFKGREGNV